MIALMASPLVRNAPPAFWGMLALTSYFIDTLVEPYSFMRVETPVMNQIGFVIDYQEHHHRIICSMVKVNASGSDGMMVSGLAVRDDVLAAVIGLLYRAKRQSLNAMNENIALCCAVFESYDFHC